MDNTIKHQRAIKTLRSIFMKELLGDAHFFTSEEFDKHRGKILSFTQALRTLADLEKISGKN